MIKIYIRKDIQIAFHNDKSSDLFYNKKLTGHPNMIKH